MLAFAGAAIRARALASPLAKLTAGRANDHDETLWDRLPGSIVGIDAR
jgi:hypothetical protein